MSDYRAIAGVTGALQQFLYGPASAAVPGASVRPGPPKLDPVAAAAGLVNIFPYQVNPNASHRNLELPTRRTDGTLLSRPQLALDIDFLLSFYGEESKLVPQILMGVSMSALHAQPTLKASDIPEKLLGRSMADSGLREQVDVLRFTLVPLSHEELHRIWSVFFQVPYTLSVIYRCSVVLIEADLDPEPAMPVRAVRLGTAPWAPRHLDRVEPHVIEPGARICIEGSGLAGGALSVDFGSIAVTPDVVGDSAIELNLPSGLAAGVNVLRVSAPPSPGESRSAGGASNPVSFVLIPKITGPPSVSGTGEGATLSLRLEPAVAAGQTVELLLNELQASGASPRSYKLKAAPDQGSDHEIAFPLRGAGSGEYLVRAEVDGVASTLETEGDVTSPDFGRYIGPKVVLS